MPTNNPLSNFEYFLLKPKAYERFLIIETFFI